MENFDIVIVGGGPSGATFAKFIDKKYKVLLLERRDFNDSSNTHIKCCGGLLNEKAQAILAALNYSIPQNILVDPQVFNIKILDLDNNLTKRYFKGYLNMDRELFDSYMLSQASPNVKIITNAIYHKFSKDSNGGYTVDYRVNGKLSVVKCQILIGADGASSRVASEIDPNDENKYIAPSYILTLGIINGILTSEIIFIPFFFALI